jgi:calcium-binding protein CML
MEATSVFAAFDEDGDGKLSASELRRGMAATLGEDVSEEEAEAILTAADADCDGLRAEPRRVLEASRRRP